MPQAQIPPIILDDGTDAIVPSFARVPEGA